jgi:hypothetical protein
MTERIDIKSLPGSNEHLTGDRIDLRTSTPTSIVRFDEAHRLRFAKQVLLFLFMLCMTVIIGYGIEPQNEAWEKMFELVKIGALPLVTLVIGFYFPSSQPGR